MKFIFQILLRGRWAILFVLMTTFAAVASTVEAPVIDNAGYGCTDGNCIWILGHNMRPTLSVEIWTANDSQRLQTYTGSDIVYSSQSLALGLKTQQEKQLFASTGLKIYLSDGSQRSNGMLVKNTSAHLPAPIIDKAGYGCEDGLCIWILGQNLRESVAVEIRTVDDSKILHTYAGADRYYSSESLTLALKTEEEKKLFSTVGLKIYLVDGAQTSNAIVVKNSTLAPPPPARELYYGYFGVSNESHLETAGHTNLVMTAGWGDWSTAQGRQDLTKNNIRYMKESRDRGVKSAMLTIDYLLFTSNFQYRGVSELRAAFTEMRAAGVLDMAVALYPVDEPDDRGFSNQKMTQINSEIRAVMAEFSELKNTKLAVFYTDHGNWPGLSSFDWVGYDSYGNGVVKPPVSGDQKIMLIPGGSNPWKEAPEPFYNAAKADSRVVMILPFLWFDLGSDHGIRSNGMAARYKSIGCQITARCSP